jgi:hypothetical protein
MNRMFWMTTRIFIFPAPAIPEALKINQVMATTLLPREV